MDARALPDSLRIVRELSVACGRSPIPGHGEIAAPIWRGSAVAGCVTVLVPNTVMTNEVRRRHLSTVVSEAAQRASLQNTLHGERPRQLQAS
jgi:DNA-binding IclR family transcriptional regulator